MLWRCERPNATDYRNRAERAEAECEELRRENIKLARIAVKAARGNHHG
jgi:hypothetical protein